MKIRPSTPEIPSDNPFANCKLERKYFANILTNVIDNSEGGFTMALNGSWGAGKSTFVKMWQSHLENADYVTVYVNAWEMDFTLDPLTAILGEINALTDNRRTFKKLLKSIHKSLFLAAGGYISSFVGNDAIRNLFNKHKSFDKEITSYCEQKEAVQEFRKELQTFIKEHNGNKPLILFIDELDRCKPSYAVEFLERIKHFFSIDNLVFVISVDKKHLAESIKGHYGSANIDTDEYLRRFFDIEFFLPEPDLKQFCEYLFYRDNFDGIESEKDKEMLLDIILRLVGNDHVTLRQLEGYMSHLKVCYVTYKEFPMMHDLIAFLLFYKLFHRDIYNGLKSSYYSIDDFSKLISDKYGDDLKTEAFKGPYKMNYLAVHLLFRYNKQLMNISLISQNPSCKIPEFNFNPYKIEQMYAHDFIQKLEAVNDGLILSDLCHLIDISIPNTL